MDMLLLLNRHSYSDNMPAPRGKKSGRKPRKKSDKQKTVDRISAIDMRFGSSPSLQCSKPYAQRLVTRVLRSAEHRDAIPVIARRVAKTGNPQHLDRSRSIYRLLTGPLADMAHFAELRTHLRGLTEEEGVRRVMQLDTENQPEATAADNCVICFEMPAVVCLLPCKHMCMCGNCAAAVTSGTSAAKCPLCRAGIVTRFVPILSGVSV